MWQTIRYLESHSSSPTLGLVSGDQVYPVTKLVPDWTEPCAMWRVLRALDLPLDVAFSTMADKLQPVSLAQLVSTNSLLAPVTPDEVWAAGVTYERSKDARNAETKIADSVYDRVYAAKRPEIFFKATGNRVTGPLRDLYLRNDSSWMVPEPELGVVISEIGEIIGFTLGNDMSSRDIEGENPLYLPQAKIFNGSCAIGPSLLWNTGEQRPEQWTLQMDILREGSSVFSGKVSVSQLRRSLDELISYLLHDNPVPTGSVLLTGTGIVPPDDFTLHNRDEIEISISEIGTLKNRVMA